MPTYQYVCTDCGEPLEAVQKFTDDALTVCPACGGTLRKVFSAVGVVFKGSGFYRNDSRSGTGSAKAAGSSDSKGTSESSTGSSDSGSSSSSESKGSSGSSESKGSSGSSESKGSSGSSGSSKDSKASSAA